MTTLESKIMHISAKKTAGLFEEKVDEKEKTIVAKVAEAALAILAMLAVATAIVLLRYYIYVM